MTAPVVASTNTNFDLSGAASIDVTKPAGTASGDWLIIHVINRSTATATCTGFSEVFANYDSGSNQTVLVKQAGGSEPSSYTVNFSAGTPRCTIAIGRITGGHASDIIDVVGTSAVGSDDAPTSPSITTTVDDALVCSFLCMTQSSSPYAPETPPSGYAEEWHADPNSGGRSAALMASKSQASAGATGAVDWSIGTAVAHQVNAVSLAPAAGGGGGATPQPEQLLGCAF